MLSQTDTASQLTVTASVRASLDDLITLNADTSDQPTFEVTGSPTSVGDYNTLAGLTGKNTGITGTLEASKDSLGALNLKVVLHLLLQLRFQIQLAMQPMKLVI